MSPQIVIVTGAGTGIGQAVCVAFAKSGAAVVAAGRTRETLEATQAKVADAGGECLVVPADVADEKAVQGLIAAAMDRFGRVDVLVNSAALAVCQPTHTIAAGDFDAMLRVNCGGVFFACKAVWPHMVRQGGGVIINISSMAAADPFPGLAAYGATKAFVSLLTKGLADEGRTHGIAVFAIGPGAVETAMLRSAFPDFPADQALAPEAVADLAVTLASPSCRHSSGQTIYIRK